MMNDEGFNVEDRSQFKILREALVNMLSHFDPFSTIHSCIHIYTDRVEFFNAGGYPVPISQLGNHLYSNPRNPIIAKIFRLVNLSETIGYGFDMMNEWKEITGNDVTFESDICTSTVTFWLDSDRASNRAIVTMSVTMLVTMSQKRIKIKFISSRKILHYFGMQ